MKSSHKCANAGCADLSVLLQQRRVQNREVVLVSFSQMGWHIQCHWLARGFILAEELRDELGYHLNTLAGLSFAP